MRLIVSGVAAAVAAVAQPAAGQAFDNAAVVKLSAAGLGEDAIVAKVRSLPCGYDLATDQLIALKRAGVANGVITAMLERCAGSSRPPGASAPATDPSATHRPGIYVDAADTGGRDMAMLRPTTVGGVKISGNGSILFPFRARLTVAQGSANLKLHGPRPVFWFYFDPANISRADFGSVSTTAAQSPNEFSLVRFKAIDAGREFVIGKMKGMAGDMGIDPRNTLRFTTTEVGDGIFKVEVGPLAPGQYGFILPGERGRYRIYDFAVDAVVAP